MFLDKALNFILPPRCPFDGGIVDAHGAVSPSAWAKLAFISAPFCHVCGFPFEFAVPKDMNEPLCAACLAERPPYERARAALAYDNASRDLILGFKHGDQTQNVVTMVPWLKMAGAELLTTADLIVPVPLHRWRLLRRRYNQAALMGKALSAAVKKPFLADLLLRVRATQTQGHLNASERHKNIRRAFAINNRNQSKIFGKNILLIDDVYTTGATVEECSRVLMKAGAGRVDVLCLARVVKPSRI